MRRLFLFICAIALPVVALISSGTRFEATAASSQNSRPDFRGVRVLKGAEAKAYVAKLRATDRQYREAMDRAEADLRARGFVEYVEGFVVAEVVSEAAATNRLGTILEWFYPSLHAQTVSQSNGRVIWNSWNDGDSRTWEGNIYGQNYNYNSSVSMNVQYNIETGDWTPYRLWHQQTGATPLEGQAATNWHGGQCNSGDLAKHIFTHAAQQRIAYCSGPAVGCIFAGPAYWQCLGAGCTAQIVMGVIDEIMAWRRECLRSCVWTNTSAGVWECK